MVTLYGLQQCQTCKKALLWLKRHGISACLHDYRQHPLPSEQVKHWADQLGGYAAIINRSSTTWRQLPTVRQSPATAAQWALLLREYPQLIRRPVVVEDDLRMYQGFSDHGFATFFSIR